MTHLQKITTLAKKIRKAKPALKWTDAIKQASKQIKPAAKKAAAKKAVKKVASKRVSGTKKPATKTHKDTKSHNVNIRVVSGVDYKAKALKDYAELLRNEKMILNRIEIIKNAKYYVTPADKRAQKTELLNMKKVLTAIRQQKAIQKKLI